VDSLLDGVVENLDTICFKVGYSSTTVMHLGVVLVRLELRDLSFVWCGLNDIVWALDLD
jgi:hypothetical protein